MVACGYGHRGLEPGLPPSGQPLVPTKTDQQYAPQQQYLPQQQYYRSPRLPPHRRPRTPSASSKQLADLKTQGILTEAEFEAQKAKILNS